MVLRASRVRMRRSRWGPDVLGPVGAEVVLVPVGAPPGRDGGGGSGSGRRGCRCRVRWGAGAPAGGQRGRRRRPSEGRPTWPDRSCSSGSPSRATSGGSARQSPFCLAAGPVAGVAVGRRRLPLSSWLVRRTRGNRSSSTASSSARRSSAARPSRKATTLPCPVTVTAPEPKTSTSRRATPSGVKRQ